MQDHRSFSFRLDLCFLGAVENQRGQQDACIRRRSAAFNCTCALDAGCADRIRFSDRPIFASADDFPYDRKAALVWRTTLDLQLHIAHRAGLRVKWLLLIAPRCLAERFPVIVDASLELPLNT